MSARRTIRRFAHELYPHPGEYEVRPLEVEVPYLYARFVGLSTFGTDWFDLWPGDHERGTPGYAMAARLQNYRILQFIDAKIQAFLADALLQGMTGDEAWQWAMSRAAYEDGEIAWERAQHYGVPTDQIKPYPVLAETQHHEHYDTSGNATGWGVLTRIDCPESECDACTEPVEAGDPR